MLEKETILFVVESGSLEYTIPGGVQVCTEELIRYFRLTSFNLEIFPVKTTRRLQDRIKIKLGIDVYNSFDYASLANEICSILLKSNISLIALNQIVFAPVVPLVRAKIKRKISFVGLSHGNESGDFLHESDIQPLVRLWKLGKQILNEKKFYSEYLDGVVVISEHEVGVNQWLGATNVLVLPRMLERQALDWQPKPGRVGFVGTLNHGPNLKGLKLVLNALQLQSFSGEVRIVGGPRETGELIAQEYTFASYLGRLTNKALEEEARTWGIFLNPVFWYSRGSSTKLAQGLNWALPSLTTPAGRRGYLLADKTIVVPSHDPAHFARAINFYSQDRSALQRLYSSVENNLSGFDAAAIARDFEQFLRNTEKCQISSPPAKSAY